MTMQLVVTDPAAEAANDAAAAVNARVVTGTFNGGTSSNTLRVWVPTAQPDANFVLTLTPASVTGTPPTGAFMAKAAAPAYNLGGYGFWFSTLADAGAGNSILWQYVLTRP